jgi:DNA protecting protein DprA
VLACEKCRRRSALIAALAPAISRRSLNHESLLGLLALPNTRLLRATRVPDQRGLLRGLRLPVPTKRVPTACCRHDPDYPEALAQLPCAPAVLYATCTPERLRELLRRPAVAIVGSRVYSSHAQQPTFELARELSGAGVTVCSGLNKGLEGIAHQGVLHDGGGAIAVMACSPDISHFTPLDPLHRGILAHGAAISEFPPGFSHPQRWCFVSSQRIIAALASILVVVEAGRGSCVLLTAEIAADLGADVAVVPGRVTDPGGLWTFALLRDGAHPVACAQDVLELIHETGVLGVRRRSSRAQQGKSGLGTKKDAQGHRGRRLGRAGAHGGGVRLGA